jgi:hypothetical protein
VDILRSLFRAPFLVFGEVERATSASAFVLVEKHDCTSLKKSGKRFNDNYRKDVIDRLDEYMLKSEHPDNQFSIIIEMP